MVNYLLLHLSRDHGEMLDLVKNWGSVRDKAAYGSGSTNGHPPTRRSWSTGLSRK